MLFAYQKYQKKKDEEDQGLWADLLEGKQKALSDLFVRHHTHLFNYGINMHADRELVRECIQMLFMNIWRRHRYLNHAVSVKAYLLSSLRRLIVEELDKKNARAIRSREYLRRNPPQAFHAEQLMIKEEITRERQHILQQAINELSPREKEAVFLRFYHGLQNPEIAEVMGINGQCVRNLLSAAIRRLRLYAESHRYTKENV